MLRHGKAGTGKTTLLERLVERAQKNVSDLSGQLELWSEAIAGKELSDKEAALAAHEQIRVRLGEIGAIADKFQRQISRLIEATEADPGSALILRQRCGKAIAYFTEQIATQLIAPLRKLVEPIVYKKKMKRYVRSLRLIEQDCWNKIERLYGAQLLDDRLYDGEIVHAREKIETAAVAAGLGRKVNGDAYGETFHLHQQGKAADEIAAMRGLTVGTIKKYLARCIGRGEVDIYSLLPAATIDSVLAFLRQHEGASMSVIKSGTGDRFDYGDIRMVVAHHLRHSAA